MLPFQKGGLALLEYHRTWKPPPSALTSSLDDGLLQLSALDKHQDLNIDGQIIISTSPNLSFKPYSTPSSAPFTRRALQMNAAGTLLLLATVCSGPAGSTLQSSGIARSTTTQIDANWSPTSAA